MHRELLPRLARFVTFIVPVMLLTGCFGEGDGKERIEGRPLPVLSGVFVDAGVQGAAYTTPSQSGTTDAAGTFVYAAGESVTLSVGGIVLGTALGAPVISSVELTGSSDPTAPAALNQLVFLQSIDSDQNPSNGITISSATASAAAGQTLDFTDPDFDTVVVGVVAAIAPGNDIVSDEDALFNFYQTYAELGGTDTFNFLFPGFPPVGTFELVFSDEFNEGTAPDPGKWGYDLGYGQGGWGNNEWQLYTDSSDNVRVEDGNLVIQARCDTPPCGVRDGSVTSARIKTQDLFEFRYGKVVARIKPPTGKGAWPAFWSLGANFPEVGWPNSGEIDFMEVHTNQSTDRTSHFTIHWCDQSVQAPLPCSFPNGWVFDSRRQVLDAPLDEDFHIFEADWDEDRIIGKIDGVEYFNRSIDAATMEEFQRDFFMILNVAMGGTLGSGGQPPDGTEVWPQTMLVDYVRVFQGVDAGGPAAFSVDFEASPDSYDFGAEGGFGGGAAAVVDNPDSSGINTSAQVARMLKFAGEPFGGSTLALSTPLTLETGSEFTMKVWSQRMVAVTFKLEGPTEAEVVVAHGGTGWEELTFSFPSFSGSVEGITFIFDNGTVGDAGGDPDNWTFYFDDIELELPDDGPGTMLSQIDLPITFEEPTVDYTVADFGGTMSTLVLDPADDTNIVVSTNKPLGAELWAGTTMSTAAGLASPIPFTATETTIGVRVYSPDAGIPVRLKAENASDDSISVETEALTTVANDWETLVFDFAAEVEGAPLDTSQTYQKLSIFFNFGTDGNTAGDKTYFWDDVIFGVLPPVIDDTPPMLTTVSIASSNADPALAVAGDTVTVTLVADESINEPVVTIAGAAADTPTGSGPSWQATRTLTAGDAEGAIAFSIEFSDLAGNAGTTVSATTDASGVSLDATAPMVSIQGAPASFTTLDPITLTFQFSEAVIGFDLADIAVTNGSAGALAGAGASYTADVTPNGSGDLSVSVTAAAAADLAGNPSLGAAAVTVTNDLDADAPLLDVVGISSSNANPAYAKAGDVVTVDMIANEAILQPTVTIAGQPADMVSGAGDTWSATRTMLATDTEGAVGFAINFEDLGNNAGPQTTAVTDMSSVTFDVTAPSVTISGVPDPVQTTDPITVTFAFDEDVEGFDIADIGVTNGTADAFVSVDAANYTADVTPDGNGDLTVTVAADAATDLAGNGNAAQSVTSPVDLTPFWQLVWSDEFDGVALDTANWNARTDADCPEPCTGVQSYRTERVSVANGLLNIEARDDVARGSPITSGLIDTRGKLEFKYGRIEIDAQLPGTVGIAPSLWMLPASDTYGSWPTSGEIDIVNAPELGVAASTDLDQVLHYGLPEPENTVTSGTYTAISPPELSVFTYALEWEAGEIRWFVDDVHVLTQTQDNWYTYYEDADGIFALGEGAAPFDENFYLVLGLTILDNAGVGSLFPQTMQVDAVRVYRCANAVDADAGTGCSTGDGQMPVDAPGAPSIVALEVYTEAPGVLSLDFDGSVYTNNLAAGFSDEPPGLVVTSSNTAFDDGGNTVWRVNVAADSPGDSGVVFVGSEDLSADPLLRTGFDLTGSDGIASELLFDLRINADTGVTMMAGLDSGGGDGGQVAVPLAGDNEWHTYSIRLADVLANPIPGTNGLDLENVINLFALEVTGGTVEFDVDNIRVSIVCRDAGTCDPAPLFQTATVEYSQNFESMEPNEGPPPNSLSNDGWDVFGIVTFNGTFLYQYGLFDAPNGGAGFSAIVDDQGGTDQGGRQLSIYNDYDNQDHGLGADINALVLRERNLDPAADIGQTITFSFDAKRGNINDPNDPACATGCTSTAKAFVKVLDGPPNFFEVSIDAIDMTSVSDTWQRYSVSIPIEEDNPGDITSSYLLQYGFETTATMFQPSGIVYDNLEVTIGPTP